MKEVNINDIKQNIENKRLTEKQRFTPKRIFEYNPNYLSDKNIFEWNFVEEPKENRYMGKTSREMINSVNVIGKSNDYNNIDYREKRIIKVDQHHKQ